MPVHLSSTCSTCTTIIQPCFAHCRERGAVADVQKPYFVRELRRRGMFGIVLECDQCLATKGGAGSPPHLIVEVGWGTRLHYQERCRCELMLSDTDGHNTSHQNPPLPPPFLPSSPPFPPPPPSHSSYSCCLLVAILAVRGKRRIMRRS